MARYTGPVCRLCRREGQKLFLKGTKCFTEKCPIERAGYPPGQHGRRASRRRKQSEYAKQLREKQKVKRIYGVLEKQFGNYFEEASNTPGVTGENLLSMLERGSTTWSTGLVFAVAQGGAPAGPSPPHRGQRARGRHPSYQVSPGERIQVKEKSRELPLILGSIESRGKESTLPWLEVDCKSQSGRMVELPTRETIPIAAEEQLIVELYSK